MIELNSIPSSVSASTPVTGSGTIGTVVATFRTVMATVRPTTLLLGLEKKYDVDLMEMFTAFGV